MMRRKRKRKRNAQGERGGRGAGEREMLFEFQEDAGEERVLSRWSCHTAKDMMLTRLRLDKMRTDKKRFFSRLQA